MLGLSVRIRYLPATNYKPSRLSGLCWYKGDDNGIHKIVSVAKLENNYGDDNISRIQEAFAFEMAMLHPLSLNFSSNPVCSVLNDNDLLYVFPRIQGNQKES